MKIFYFEYAIIGMSIMSLSLLGEIEDNKIEELKSNIISISKNFNKIKNTINSIEENKLTDKKFINDLETIVVDLDTNIFTAIEKAKKAIDDNNVKMEIEVAESKKKFEDFMRQEKVKELARQEQLHQERLKAREEFQAQLHQLKLKHEEEEIIFLERKKARQQAEEAVRKQATDQFNQKTQELKDRIDKFNQEMAEQIGKWNSEHQEKVVPNVMFEQQSFSTVQSKSFVKNAWFIMSTITFLVVLLYKLMNSTVNLPH